ncbi:MAG: cbb3-type cytochrome c oxidase subunit 3 [Thermomonas sp.]
MLSGIVTSILLILFLAGWAWAWSPRRRADFDAAAMLPLDDAQPVDVANPEGGER